MYKRQLIISGIGKSGIIGQKISSTLASVGIPSFYVDDREVIILASSLLILAGLFQLSDGVQAVGLGVLRGIRDTKIPTLVTFISYWMIAIPLSYYLGIISDYGLFGVWIGLSVGLTIAAVFHILRFNYLTSAK